MPSTTTTSAGEGSGRAAERVRMSSPENNGNGTSATGGGGGGHQSRDGDHVQSMEHFWLLLSNAQGFHNWRVVATLNCVFHHSNLSGRFPHDQSYQVVYLNQS